MSLHKTHICVVKSLVKIAAVSWHSLRRFVKPAPEHNIIMSMITIVTKPRVCNRLFMYNIHIMLLDSNRKYVVHIYLSDRRIRIHIGAILRVIFTTATLADRPGYGIRNSAYLLTRESRQCAIWCLREHAEPDVQDGGGVVMTSACDLCIRQQQTTNASALALVNSVRMTQPRHAQCTMRQ